MPKAHVLKQRLKVNADKFDGRDRAIKLLMDKQARRPLTEGEQGRLRILLKGQELAGKNQAKIEIAAQRAEMIEAEREAA